MKMRRSPKPLSPLLNINHSHKCSSSSNTFLATCFVILIFLTLTFHLSIKTQYLNILDFIERSALNRSFDSSSFIRTDKKRHRSTNPAVVFRDFLAVHEQSLRFAAQLDHKNPLLNKNKNKRLHTVVVSQDMRIGYANRIYGILSVLVLAVLTDSGVIIEWDMPNSSPSNDSKKIINEYIDDSFRFSRSKTSSNSLLQPSILNSSALFHKLIDIEKAQQNRSYNSPASDTVKTSQIKSTTRHKWKIKKDFYSLTTPNPDSVYDILEEARGRFGNSSENEGTSTLLLFTLQTNAAHIFEYCAEPRFYDKLLKYKLVSPRLISRVRADLKNKTDERGEKLERLLLIGFQVANRLLRYFWQPSSSMQRLILLYKSKLFSESLNETTSHDHVYYKIGIQLRTQFLDHPRDTLKFVACAMQIEREQQEIFKSKKMSWGSSGVKLLRFVWFITADAPNVIQDFKKNFTTKNVKDHQLWRNVVSVIDDETFANKSVNDAQLQIGHTLYNAKALNRTILDLALLSDVCDEMIVTGGSTFGFLANMYSGRLSYYVNGKQGATVNSNGSTESSSCMRTVLSRPPVTPTGFASF